MTLPVAPVVVVVEPAVLVAVVAEELLARMVVWVLAGVEEVAVRACVVCVATDEALVLVLLACAPELELPLLVATALVCSWAAELEELAETDDAGAAAEEEEAVLVVAVAAKASPAGASGQQRRTSTAATTPREEA